MLNVCFNSLNAVNKNVKRASLAFLFFASLGAASPSPSPTPSASPDLVQVPEFALQEAQKNAAKDQYQIGDRIALLAEIKATGLENGDKLTLKLPEGSSKLEDQGWYIDQSTQFLGGVFRFIVSPIQPGSRTLPTLLVLKEDQSVIGRTAPFTIQVSGPQKANQKPAELLDLTSSSLPVKYWVLLGLIALILSGGIIYLIYRYRKSHKKVPVVRVPNAPTEADHVVALRKIETLFEELPFTRANLKPMSFALSEILKSFFSKRFKIDASESTTDEMIELLRREAIAGTHLREIQVLFQDLDLIKFTKNENYTHIDQPEYHDFKVRAQVIVQKWALQQHPAGGAK